jgi:hypothetical protein
VSLRRKRIRSEIGPVQLASESRARSNGQGKQAIGEYANVHRRLQYAIGAEAMRLTGHLVG